MTHTILRKMLFRRSAVSLMVFVRTEWIPKDNVAVHCRAWKSDTTIYFYCRSKWIIYRLDLISSMIKLKARKQFFFRTLRRLRLHNSIQKVYFKTKWLLAFFYGTSFFLLLLFSFGFRHHFWHSTMSVDNFKTNIYEYLETLPTFTFMRLFEKPATCLAIFRYTPLFLLKAFFFLLLSL